MTSPEQLLVTTIIKEESLSEKAREVSLSEKAREVMKLLVNPLSFSEEAGDKTSLLSNKMKNKEWNREMHREYKELTYANQIVEYLEKIRYMQNHDDEQRRCDIHYYSKLDDEQKRNYEEYHHNPLVADWFDINQFFKKI